tara:strand:- start:1185 stop:1436 length:252 start_codon:yes stop_codon:yes gene_type:complete
MRAKPQSFLTLKQPECQPFLNMTTKIYPNTLEPLLGPTPESLLREMEEKFPPVNPHPKEELASIMYKAGQRAVVEWYYSRLEK